MKKWIALLVMTLFLSLTSSMFAAPPPNVNNMIYLYGSNSTTYQQQLEGTYEQVGTLVPGYFGLTPDGNLKSFVDQNFVQYAHKKNYRVTPFITNDWNREVGIKAMENWRTLADDLVQAAIRYDLDGINVDIENLTFDQRELQTKFLTRLRDQLHPLGKTVSIAVAPASYDTNIGWVGSYDFEAIGKIADTVYIMAYDQSYPNGPEGPVAGMPWVEKSIQYLIKKIPKDKLVLGVPFYGRYWTDTVKGNGIYYSNAMKLIRKNNAAIEFDPVNVTNVSRFRDQSSGKNYVIWFDSADTILERVHLVDKYGLKGWGAWHLGQEDTAIWSLLNNPSTFKDIENHWAKEEILLMAEQQWMKGYEDHSFRPQKPISREEVATLLTTALKLDPSKAALSYKDLAKNRWSFSYVSTISTYGLMKGYPDNTFRPTHSITRAEFAASLARSFALPDQKQTSAAKLSDIKDHWAYDDIQKLYQAGIITGYGDGTFRPNQTVTRAEAAVMLGKIIR